MNGGQEEPVREDAIAAALQPVVNALLAAHEQRIVAAHEAPSDHGGSFDTPDSAILLELIVVGALPTSELERRIDHAPRTVRAALKRLELAGIAIVDASGSVARLDPAITHGVADSDLEPLRRTVGQLTNGDRPRFMRALLVLAEESRRD